MASATGERKKTRWYKKLRNKYRLVLMNDSTLEERLTFRLSRLNVFIALGTLTIILIFLTTILIAFTPLKEYIPGYTNVGLQKQLYELQIKTDSVQKALVKKDLFLKNLQDVINGKDLQEDRPVLPDTTKKYGNIRLKKSEDDSLLRLEVETQGKYNLFRQEDRETSFPQKLSLGGVLFFTPLKGVITSEFNPSERHFGVDIVAKQNEAIKSVLDGTVLFSEWTLQTGYVIAIQHPGNIISIYKHNSALLKHAGDIVRAGDPIAIIGESGELATGPHLHLEIWSDGNPVNPKDYISF
ncbi:MAG TPA: M23 family metallopeptidase [Bacteroidales bacterium]|nr:M23 family metallopeptidase [Bacteroidales bacterium]